MPIPVYGGATAICMIHEHAGSRSVAMTATTSPFRSATMVPADGTRNVRTQLRTSSGAWTRGA